MTKFQKTHGAISKETPKKCLNLPLDKFLKKTKEGIPGGLSKGQLDRIAETTLEGILKRVCEGAL